MKEYDIRINYVHFNENNIVIGWSAKGIGFGTQTVYRIASEDAESFYIDTECMSESFRDAVFKAAFEYIIANGVKE